MAKREQTMTKYEWAIKLQQFLDKRAAKSNMPHSEAFKLGYVTSMFAEYIAENPNIAANVEEGIRYALSCND